VQCVVRNWYGRLLKRPTFLLEKFPENHAESLRLYTKGQFNPQKYLANYMGLFMGREMRNTCKYTGKKM
jgi:hypothetical protein